MTFFWNCPEMSKMCSQDDLAPGLWGGVLCGWWFREGQSFWDFAQKISSLEVLHRKMSVWKRGLWEMAWSPTLLEKGPGSAKAGAAPAALGT